MIERAVVSFLGDQAVIARFGDAAAITPALHAQVMAALAAFDRAPPAGVVDVVPGYASLLVVYDPATADPDAVRAALTEAAAAPVAERAPPRTIEIPVLYHPDVAPDLVALAAEKGLAPAQLAALHAAPTYLCYTLGFRPGFPFLGGLPEALAAARLATPRLRVPAGSVGIGGAQTGVYPSDGPGGWRLIGRTPLRVFDPARADPFLVHAGDHVRFVPIDEAAYGQLA